MSMTPDKHIIEELNLIGVFLGDSIIRTPYKVPDAYFQHLPEIIFDKISLGFAAQENVYQVPSGYFSNLASQVMNKLEVESELSEIAPLLAGIKRANIYQKPDQRFPTTEITQAIEKPVAKLYKINYQPNWLKYTAAAVLIGIIIFAGVVLSNQQDKVDYTAYLQLDPPNDISNISIEELDTYLSNQVALTDVLYKALSEPNEITDIKTSLESTSDDVLEQYIEADTLILPNQKTKS